MKMKAVAEAGLAISLLAALSIGCSGDLTTEATPKCPTVVSITSPAEDQNFKPGAEIPLIGRIEENRTADLTTLDVAWVVTGTPADGSPFVAQEFNTHPLETGEVKSTLRDIPLGTFTVTLKGFDTVEGKECSSMSRTFHVVNNPPEIRIVSPTERLTVNPGEDVVITGTVSDPDTDDPPESLTLSVEDDQEPGLVYSVTRPESDGSWTIVASFSTPGLHNNIYVFATDTAGSSGRAGPIEVEVNECDPIDRDGDGYTSCQGDCDDTNQDVNPDGTEVCDDGIDNDCDGLVDAGVDADGDGFDACVTGELRDCDDNMANTYPGASESCDGFDNNCDGVVPDSEVDEDGDGFRLCGKDCDDTDPTTYDGAAEQCDGKDNDCDTVLPVGEQDLDSDGVMACADPPDCDDRNDQVSPYAPELCGNRIDDDCDGQVDEESVAEDDLDGDGHVCDDCAPNDPNVYNGALEGVDEDGDGIPECDGIDNDCDPEGIIDNDTSCMDDDGDGYSELDGDCDDYQPYTYPGAVERPDNQDNNCDGQVEGVLDLSRSHVRLYGTRQDGRLGNSVGAGADVNGDGYQDFVVGAYNYDMVSEVSQGRGAAFVVFGGDDAAWIGMEGQDIESHAILLYEEEGGAKAGWAVTMVGDMNGDPYGDFAVSAPYHSTTKANNVGRAYIVFGTSDGWGTSKLSDFSGSIVEGQDTLKDSANTLLGFSLAGGGDANGDGLDDLLVGVPWETSINATGFLLIVPGKQERFETIVRPSDLCMVVGQVDRATGISVAYSGYSNEDGLEDIAVGTYHDYTSSPGSVYWLTGDASFVEGGQFTFAKEDAREYYGTVNYDYVGDSVSGQVDVDHDGYEDLLIGRRNSTASGEEEAPLAYLVFGRSIFPTTGEIDYVPEMIRFMPSASGQDECPCLVQGIGDMDGDGIDDFAIGVSRNDENGHDAGKIYIFHGKESREAWGTAWVDDILDLSVDSADLMILGEHENELAPGALAAGDVNNDGRRDLIVGVPEWTGDDGVSGGQVYVIFGYPAGKNPSPYDSD